MPTVFVTGDLFAIDGLDGLAHGCNCAGRMGKGIALEFRRSFPKMYTENKKRREVNRFQFGEFFVWREEPLTVFNLGTQPTWKKRAELWAVERSLARMVDRRSSSLSRGLGYHESRPDSVAWRGLISSPS